MLAASLAWFNRWYQTQASSRAAAFWGPAATRCLISATHVEALLLRDGSIGDRAMAADTDDLGGDAIREARRTLDAAGARLAIVRRVDASQARGLLHVRRALLSDGLFDWGAAPPPRLLWTYALTFSAGESSCTILLDGECRYAASLAEPACVVAIQLVQPPKEQPSRAVRSPLWPFVSEQFATPTGKRGETGI